MTLHVLLRLGEISYFKRGDEKKCKDSYIHSNSITAIKKRESVLAGLLPGNSRV